MRHRAVDRGNRVAVLALLGALVPVTLVGLAGPALAHDVLVGTTPADGDRFAVAPSEVVLTFSADQLGLGAAVTVTGPDEGSWADGEAVVEGAVVRQALVGDMPPGEYTVEWRSVSGDGHPVDGTFTFAVDGAAEGPTPTPSTSTAGLPTPTPEPTADVPTAAAPDDGAGQGGVEGAAWVPVVVALAAVLAVTGAAVVARRRR